MRLMEWLGRYIEKRRERQRAVSVLTNFGKAVVEDFAELERERTERRLAAETEAREIQSYEQLRVHVSARVYGDDLLDIDTHYRFMAWLDIIFSHCDPSWVRKLLSTTDPEALSLEAQERMEGPIRSQVSRYRDFRRYGTEDYMGEWFRDQRRAIELAELAHRRANPPTRQAPHPTEWRGIETHHYCLSCGDDCGTTDTKYHTSSLARNLCYPCEALQKEGWLEEEFLDVVAWPVVKSLIHKGQNNG